MILLCKCSLSLDVCNIGLQCNLLFLSTTVLQGSVATQVNYGKILIHSFTAKFTAECEGKRILKIGYDLAKLWQKIKWHLFSRHGVQMCKFAHAIRYIVPSKQHFHFCRF